MNRNPLSTAWKSLAGAALACAALGCSASPGNSQTITPTLPSYAQFVGADDFTPGVHTFLENQCGTLDCHGQVGRPFRLYSVNGLRQPNDAGNIAGSGAQTASEQFANYISAVNLEPEEMTQVVQNGASPLNLILMKKPMGLERHKGGTRILPSGDPQYACLFGWLSGAFNNDVVTACAAAAALN